jgi:hypothetical protein
VISPSDFALAPLPIFFLHLSINESRENPACAMPRSKSIASAEKAALGDKNESQDSQLVLEQYMAKYGIGFVCGNGGVECLQGC